MSNYYLSHSAAELDEAVEKVLTGYKDVSSVTATGNDVVIGKTIVDSNGKVITGSLNTDQFYSEGYTAGVVDGNATGYAQGYEQGLEDATPTLQSKEVIPSLIGQEVTADTGFDGLLSVFVQAVPQSILDAEYQKGYDEAFELYKPYKQELGYIESSGTQYINTGFNPNQDTRVLIETYCPLNSGSLCGAIGTGGTKRYGVYVGNNYRNDYNTSTLNGSTTNVTNKFTLDKNKNVQTVNGVSSTATYAQFSVDKPLYLFAFNEWGTANYFGTGIKIYSCQIYDNGTLIRDFMPVLDWEDVPCLYDKVTHKLYYNAGTGAFGFPRDLPEGYTQVSYIQSSGTQYIDTLFGSTKGWKTKLGWMFTVAPTTAEQDVIASVYNSGSTYWREYVIARNSKWALGHYSNSGYSGSVSANVRYEIEASTISGNGYLIVDGVQIFNYTTTYSAHPAYNVYLFAMHESSGATSKASGRLYYLKLYDETGNLVRDYVPCTNQSGTAGLYDLVNNKFYTNAGTGTFTYA